MTETQTTQPADETLTCYVCGSPEHAPTELHRFWPIADARREFAAEPSGPFPSMSAAETLDPREAIYR